jgi:hypothetical protein
MDPREDDAEFAAARPTFDDLRADYDDDFGRLQSPFEIARRRLFVPGLSHITIGAIGILGMLVAAGATLYEYLDEGLDDWEQAVELFLLEGLIGLGVVLFALVIVGGISMMQLRRRWLCLFAAYVVTGLSLGGCYAILFYPFGIWALVVLYRPDVREQFGQGRPPPMRNDAGW